jgi:hypothetical protein
MKSCHQSEADHLFLDKYCIPRGVDYRMKICEALSRTLVAVPIISHAALNSMSERVKRNESDTLLFEWILILELCIAGKISRCLPLFFGEVTTYGERVAVSELPAFNEPLLCQKENEAVREKLEGLRLTPSPGILEWTLGRVVEELRARNGYDCARGSSHTFLPMKHRELFLRRNLIRECTDQIVGTVKEARTTRLQSEPRAPVELAPSVKSSRSPKAVAKDEESRREATDPPSPAVKDVTKPVILGFFAKKRDHHLGVHGEAQQIYNLFSDDRRSAFMFHQNPEPTFEDFQKEILAAIQKNVRVVHLAGHGSTLDGLLWFKKLACQSGPDYNKVPLKKFAGVFEIVSAGSEDGGTVECVVLNACNTVTVGKLLRKFKVPHVVCWRSEVNDETAIEFAKHFYTALTQDSTNYRRAFKMAWAFIRSPHLCWLSKDKDIVADDDDEDDSPDEDIVPSGNEDMGDEIKRNWREPGVLADGTRVDAATDYAAHAGQAERKCMELLGFPMTLPGKSEPIKVGEGIYSNGFINDPDVLKMWGVASYTSGVWGFDKSPIRLENKAIEKARLVMRSPGGSNTIGLAVQALAEVEKHRVNDMRQHENDNLLGLKWKKTINPGRGRSLRNSGLAAALTRKTEFTKQEWESFGITDLHKDDFIKLDIWTFIPEIKNRCPGTCPTNLECAPCQSLRKPKWRCADCKRLNCENCGKRETHEYQLKQITDTREALEKLIQDDLSAGVAALSVTTRGAGTGWQHADDGVRSIQMSEANASGLSMAAGARPSHAQITPAQHQVNTERAETFSTIDDWLRSIALEDYAAAIKQYGYNSFQALDAASEEEITEMTQDPDVEMKKPHRKLFLVEWRKRVQAAGS